MPQSHFSASSAQHDSEPSTWPQLAQRSLPFTSSESSTQHSFEPFAKPQEPHSSAPSAQHASVSFSWPQPPHNAACAASPSVCTLLADDDSGVTLEEHPQQTMDTIATASVNENDFDISISPGKKSHSKWPSSKHTCLTNTRRRNGALAPQKSMENSVETDEPRESYRFAAKTTAARSSTACKKAAKASFAKSDTSPNVARSTDLLCSAMN